MELIHYFNPILLVSHDLINIMVSRAFRAGYAVPPHVLLVPSYARGLVPCGGTAATAISGLPARLARLTAWFPRPRFVDREGAAGQGRAVEGVYGRLRRAAVRHLDEAKARDRPVSRSVMIRIVSTLP